MYGYSKTELLNKPTETIMPTLFAVNHADFLKRYLE